jgi:hypothetical protein
VAAVTTVVRACGSGFSEKRIAAPVSFGETVRVWGSKPRRLARSSCLPAGRLSKRKLPFRPVRTLRFNLAILTSTSSRGRRSVSVTTPTIVRAPAGVGSSTRCADVTVDQVTVSSRLTTALRAIRRSGIGDRERATDVGSIQPTAHRGAPPEMPTSRRIPMAACRGVE